MASASVTSLTFERTHMPLSGRPLMPMSGLPARSVARGQDGLLPLAKWGSTLASGGSTLG